MSRKPFNSFYAALNVGYFIRFFDIKLSTVTAQLRDSDTDEYKMKKIGVCENQ